MPRKRKPLNHPPLFLPRPEGKNQNRGRILLAGVDEAGRGALAGPVVAAAVILYSKNWEHRIDDSKKLSPLQREETYHELFSKAEIGIGVIPEAVIDRINILQATLLAMHDAISRLKVQPDLVLIDGKFVPQINLPCQPVIDGDALIPCISAASIIAKVTRDTMMRELDSIYPQYGFARHKGYGTRLHMEALQSYGPTAVHRKTFSPVKSLLVPSEQV